MPGKLFAAALAALSMLLLTAGSAAAAPVVDGEFGAQGVQFGTNNKLVQGPDGNMWVTLEAGGDVAKIEPDGTITPFDSANMSSPLGIAASAQHLWVTQNGGVARFSPGDPVGAEQFAIAEITTFHSIVMGTDGNLWVATADNLIKVPPATPMSPEIFPLPGLSPRDIDQDANGTLWIADFGNEQVVNVTPAGAPTPFAAGGGVQGVAAGANQVAFSQQGQAPTEVGLLTPPGPAAKTPVPNTDPFGVARGADTAYWAAQFTTDSLARLTADNQFSTLGGFSANSGPRQIAAGPNNTLWVTLDLAEKIGRVTGLEPPPTGGDELDTEITKGPDKKVESKKAKAEVKFKFTSPTANTTFECKLKKPKKRNGGKNDKRAAKFKACESPKKYKLKPGKYTFSVRAVLGELRDATPAKQKFKVVSKN